MRNSETELFKDKVEVTLDGRQIFYLFFGGAVIASLVFVLGVMVGKRVILRSQVAGGAVTSVASDPLAALDQLGSDRHEELVFQRALTGGGKQSLGSVDEALAGDSAEDSAGSHAGTDKPAVAKPITVEKADDEPDKPKVSLKAAPAPVAEPVATPAKEVHTPARRSSQFTLQLSSFQNRSEADSFYGKLKEAGYAPYVVEAEVPGKGLWYRVRLGKYDSYSAAIEAKKKFERREKTVAYVTRLKK